MALEEVEEDGLHLEGGVAVEREDALRVEREVARQPLDADPREDELERLERLEVDAGGQRRVEALVEPLRDEHLVRHHVELRVLVEHALQLQQVGDQVGPLLRALEVEQHRLGLRLEARERLVAPHARVGLLDRLERGGGQPSGVGSGAERSIIARGECGGCAK